MLAQREAAVAQREAAAKVADEDYMSLAQELEAVQVLPW